MLPNVNRLKIDPPLFLLVVHDPILEVGLYTPSSERFDQQEEKLCIACRWKVRHLMSFL